MADSDLGELAGFVDKRRVKGQTGSALATSGNYDSVGAMRTRLAAVNGAYYTTARLNSMTENDMVYALRQADDAAGIK